MLRDVEVSLTQVFQGELEPNLIAVRVRLPSFPYESLIKEPVLLVVPHGSRICFVGVESQHREPKQAKAQEETDTTECVNDFGRCLHRNENSKPQQKKPKQRRTIPYDTP